MQFKTRVAICDLSLLALCLFLENCACGAFIRPSNPVGEALYLLVFFFSRVLRKPISNNKMDRCCKKYQDFFTIVCPSRNSCRNAVAYNSFNQVDNSEFKKIRRQLQRKRYIKIDLCVRLSVLRLFHVGHVVPNRRGAISLA